MELTEFVENWNVTNNRADSIFNAFKDEVIAASLTIENKSSWRSDFMQKISGMLNSKNYCYTFCGLEEVNLDYAIFSLSVQEYGEREYFRTLALPTEWLLMQDPSAVIKEKVNKALIEFNKAIDVSRDRIKEWEEQQAKCKEDSEKAELRRLKAKYES